MLTRLPAPKFKVVQKNNPRCYEVTRNEVVHATYPGVTSVNSIIAKPALVPWAAKMVYEDAMGRFDAKFAKVKAKGKKAKTKRITVTDKWVAEQLLEAKKAPNKKKDKAADIGTRAHQYIDWHIKTRLGTVDAGMGTPLIITDDIRPPVEAFLAFEQDAQLQWIAGDTNVANPEQGYGGAIDALAVSTKPGPWEGKILLVDFKTSSSIFEEMALQVAAYSHAFRHTYGLSVDKAIILRFGKTGDFEYRLIKDIDNAYDAFKDALALQRSLKAGHFA